MCKKKWYGIIALAVIFMLTAAACRNEVGSCSHTWDWIVTTAPTTTADGEETFTCLLCGETGIKRSIPSVPAVISSVTINVGAPVNGGTPFFSRAPSGHYRKAICDTRARDGYSCKTHPR